MKGVREGWNTLTEFWPGNLTTLNYVDDQVRDYRMILKWILQKKFGRVWTGLIRLRTGTSGGHLWRRQCISEVHKRRETVISWLALPNGICWRMLNETQRKSLRGPWRFCQCLWLGVTETQRLCWKCTPSRTKHQALRRQTLHFECIRVWELCGSLRCMNYESWLVTLSEYLAFELCMSACGRDIPFIVLPDQISKQGEQ
jgi:hypothetical protein